MMAGTTPRRIKLAAVATGVMVAGVLAVPTLASAQGVDEPSTTATTMDMPTTVTTVASTTTSTVPASTTTTTRLPQLTEVEDIYHPGDSVTVSGKGCLIDGKPGYVIAVWESQTGASGFFQNYVVASPTGNFSLTVTLPADIPAGPAFVLPGCTTAEGTGTFALDGGIIFRVEIPGVPPSGTITTNPSSLRRGALARLAAPKAVAAKPAYTG